MKQIKKILVPLDGSKNSLRGLNEAMSFAKKFDATITGMTVVGNLPVTGIHNVASWRKNWKKEAEKDITQAKKLVTKNKIKFNEKISYGNPGSEITNYAKSNNFDLIVIGSRGRGSVKEAFLGSTSNYVLHKAKASVVLVK